MFVEKEYDAWSHPKGLELQASIHYLENEIDFVRREHENHGMSEREKLQLRVIIQKLASTITGLEDSLSMESAERTLTREDMQQLRDLLWSVQQKFDNFAYSHDRNASQLDELREMVCELQTKFYGSRTKMETYVCSVLSAAFETQDVAAKSYIDAKFAELECTMRDELESISLRLLRRHGDRGSNAENALNQRPILKPSSMSLSEELGKHNTTLESRDMTQDILTTVQARIKTSTKTEPLKPQPNMSDQPTFMCRQDGPIAATQGKRPTPSEPSTDRRAAARESRPILLRLRNSGLYDRLYSESKPVSTQIISLGSSDCEQTLRYKVECRRRTQTGGHTENKVLSELHKPEEADGPQRGDKKQKSLNSNPWKCRAPKALQHEIRCGRRW